MIPLLYTWTIIYTLTGHLRCFWAGGLNCLNLNDITILYGNNGSGKSTILNVIGEKIKATRRKELFIEKIWNPPYGFYELFKDYLIYVACRLGYDKENGIDMRLPNNIRLITSDDIFSEINEIIKNNTISVGEADKAHYEYNEKRNEHYQLKGMYDFEEFSKRVQMKKMSNRQFIEKFSRKKYDLHSNGETALEYFDKMFEPNGIYLLDEPENCLSPIFQLKLM